MKKTVLYTLLASLLLFTSCQDPIYEAIREDVEPEEATVSGNIGNITRYTASGKEFLVLAADNGLRYKQKDINSHGAWDSYSLPFALHSYDFDSSSHSGEQIIGVFADSTTLYLLSAVYTHTSTEGLSYPYNIKLWGRVITANGNSWTSAGEWKLITEDNSAIFPIALDSSTEYYISCFHVFQTNSPIQAHRKVYVKTYNLSDKAYHYFEFNGLSVPTEITIDASSIIDPSPSSDSSYVPLAKSAVYFNGSVKFFTSPVSTTNETYTSEATYYYYTNGNNKIYCANANSIVKQFDANSDNTVSSLATCTDAMLIGYGTMSSGNGGGIDKATLIDGLPDKIVDFSTNAKFQIPNNYMVLAVLNAHPEKSEAKSGLYAAVSFSGTSANFENVGLWSYYPERGNWNRE